MATVNLAYDLFDEDVNPEACPIILMHGMFWNKFVLRDLAIRLSKELNCKVYSLDLRNHGDSPTVNDVTVELLAADVKKFLHDKRIGKANFVCHSFSSMVAYLVLLDQPDAVEKVVMIDCPPFITDNEKQTIPGIHQIKEVQERMSQIIDPSMTLAQAKSWLQTVASKADLAQRYVFKAATSLLTKANGKFKCTMDLELWTEKYEDEHFFSKPRGSSNHEILVLRCNDSVLVWDKKFEDILKHNPRAKLVTFEDSSHLLMFDREKKFVEIVKEFLNSPSDQLETRRTV